MNTILQIYTNFSLPWGTWFTFHRKKSKNKNSKVESLITGIYDKKPPKPKHVFIWHVEVFLKHLNRLLSNEVLSLKEVPQKLAMHLALAPACRSSQICLLNVNYMLRITIVIAFSLTNSLKLGERVNQPLRSTSSIFQRTPNFVLLRL